MKTYSLMKFTLDKFSSDHSMDAFLFVVIGGDLLQICWKTKYKVIEGSTYRGHSRSDAEEMEITDEGAPCFLQHKN